MTPGIRPLIAGNWKMNGAQSSLTEIQLIADGFKAASGDLSDGLICVPATLLHQASALLSGSGVSSGGQDCHQNEKGAHTGDISAEMLADSGASSVLVGHSERRTDHGESDAIVAEKAKAAWRAGLVAVICIGETKSERESGETLAILSRQIDGSVPVEATSANTIIAYEPVWAIGTGLIPTLEDVAEAHAHIRLELAKKIGGEAAQMRILYGGSVNPSNAAELFAVDNVDGGLIGGASLKSVDFLGIAQVLKEK